MKKVTAVQIFSLIAIAVGVAISYFPPPAHANAIWALITGFLGYAIRDLFAKAPATTVNPSDVKSDAPTAAPAVPTSQSGFIRFSLLLTLTAVTLGALALGGCTAMNQMGAAFNNYTAANYTSLKNNIQNRQDQDFKAWSDYSCNIPLGALQRNVTGNPEAVKAAVEACPPGGGVASSQSTLTAVTPAASGK